MMFSGEVVVVSGAAGGIGIATVDAFEAQGARVAALDRVESAGRSLRLRCDLADDGACRDRAA